MKLFPVMLLLLLLKVLEGWGRCTSWGGQAVIEGFYLGHHQRELSKQAGGVHDRHGVS
jgi:hypothetical protein